MFKWARKRVWLAGLVIALGVLLVWLDPRSPNERPIDPDAQAEEPGHVLENAKITLFGESGRVEQSLASPLLIYIPQRAAAEATQPEATLYDSDNREWLANANQGTLNTDTQALTLLGEARLLAPTEGWQLDTEELHYDGLARHAWSEAPALLQQPPQQMSATRMDVWLDDSQVRLTDNVRGHHPPATQTP
ncbi:LPS export ABC transporter periplasmic protein LptC [Vreelandella populi]|uniref:LPS export ABC transporter periplasmic protein LptC n=1 Tax=Vreelandella populi TaxID=2498858 RepID=A0A3S1E6W1_9GAMM|nr:LPS export ABC transporter periplasmic protein LptC [Halomonas populi]RUR42549.1 LPS export ABC transporter periplasmic protein LptC [Halomonas populi]RUR45848.1 LPS export ABC transporter periplasmic protein LptC [Halomonas populi]RUR57152.1 LPS export ABC transporter periplasmic protein LptC [Halomonas populi]